MKNLLNVFVACIFGLSAYGNKYTLNNSPGSPADFTDAVSAVSGVSDGDTIYVQPTTTSYGTISINKRIVLLGAGHNPEFTSARSEFSIIEFYTGSGESIIKGVYVSNILRVMSSQNVPNVLLSDNFFTGQNVMTTEGWSTAPNWIIEGNVIYSTTNWLTPSTFTDNTIFRNNLICHVGSSIFYSLPPGLTFDHNTFIFSTSSTVSSIFTNSTGINVTNNILYIVAPATGSLEASCTSCYWDNNITYSVNSTIADLPGNNLNNVDPLFVNVPTSSPNFLYTNDYSLTAVSPAVATATDGTDIGLTGGIKPFNMYGFDTALPRIQEVLLLNNSAPVNGTIGIHIRGVASGN